MPNYKKLDQVLDLAHRTGDKIIVISEHHDPYVVMSIREYEALLHGSSPIQGLSEDELLDKINRDIAVWKASQEEGSNFADYDLDKFKVDMPKKDAVSAVALPSEGKPLAAKSEIEPEEDKYYIEPID